MADNKVKFLRGTAAEYEASTKDSDVFYYTTDTKKLYLGVNEVGNGIDPEVIQAHIDNQTIHAKVWKGTQEEYNAIEPKEDDTIYIIKDSDNTLADKLIDDSSTTATDKTWSAKKINENDEQTRAAIEAHAGNADIHVTAAEKAVWNGKADVDACVPVATGLNFSTSAKEYAETYKSGAENIEFTWRGFGATDAPYSDGDWFFHAYKGDNDWIRVVAFDIRDTASYEISKRNGSWGSWKKLADGGNANSVGAYTEEKLAALEARIAALEAKG